MIFKKTMKLPVAFLTDPYGLHIRALETVDKSREASAIAFAGMPEPMWLKSAGEDYFLCKETKIHLYSGVKYDEGFELYEVPTSGGFVMYLNPVKTQTHTKRRIPLWESGELSEFIQRACDHYFTGVTELERMLIREIYLRKSSVSPSPIHTVMVWGRYDGLAEDFETKLLQGFGKCRSFGYGTPVLFTEVDK